VAYRLVFSPEAQTDLVELYDHIADQAGRSRARAYLERIERFCAEFSDFPLRGTRRDELRSGLRTVGFERRITIAFHVGADLVTIDRILYGGRDLDRMFDGDRRTITYASASAVAVC
jgi:toxin ParE1/3/4